MSASRANGGDSYAGSLIVRKPPAAWTTPGESQVHFSRSSRLAGMPRQSFLAGIGSVPKGIPAASDPS
ncbi:MAG: hypothetical protein ACKN81_14760 [Pirellulaceae bacterium]